MSGSLKLLEILIVSAGMSRQALFGKFAPTGDYVAPSGRTAGQERRAKSLRPAVPATEKSPLSEYSQSLAKLPSSFRSIQGAESPSAASMFLPRQRSMDMISRTITTFAFVVSIWASTATAQDTIRWETDLATGQRLAAQTNRLVLVHFWGTWCPPCMEMEKSVFNKPGLGTAVHPYYVPVKIQVEDGMNQDLVKKFQVDGFPCDIVMTAQGQVVSRSKGFKPAGEYVAMLNQAAQQALAAARPIAANAATAPHAAAAPSSPYAVPAVAPASPYAMQQTATTAAPVAATPAAVVPVASTVGSRYSTTYTPPAASPTTTSPQPAALPQTPVAGAPTMNAPPAAAGARTDDRYASYYSNRGATPTAAPTVATPAAPLSNTAPASPVAASPTMGVSAATTGSRYAAPTTGDRYAASGVGDRYAASPQVPATNAAMPTTPSMPPPAVAPTMPAAINQPVIASTNPTTPPAIAATAAAAAPTTVAPAAVAPKPAMTQPALAQSAPLASAPPKPQPLTSNPAPTTTAPAAKSAAQAALLARIPAGSPPLALDGYCPVTVTDKMVWKQGDPQFGAVHKGRTYLFASAADQQKFLANPDKFSPIISGNDPVAIVEEGRIVSGNRDFGVFCGGQMVLFSSAENCNKYRADQKRYDAGLRQAMQSGAALRR